MARWDRMETPKGSSNPPRGILDFPDPVMDLLVVPFNSSHALRGRGFQCLRLAHRLHL